MNIKYDENYYKRFRQFVNLYVKTCYKINVSGIDNLVYDTNYILSGNHLNILDSWILMYLTNNNLRFMVDKKLYNTLLGEYFFKKIGTFPIDRNSLDVNAIKKTCEILKNKENVVIFPEGKTHKINEDLPFNNGVPRIAAMNKVPIIPFGIIGKYTLGSEININIGKPIDFNNIDLPKKEWDNYFEQTVRKLEKKF